MKQVPATYARETRSRWAHCAGQDWANLLFTVPALLVSAVMAGAGFLALQLRHVR